MSQQLLARRIDEILSAPESRDSESPIVNARVPGNIKEALETVADAWNVPVSVLVRAGIDQILASCRMYSQNGGQPIYLTDKQGLEERVRLTSN